MRHAIPIPAVPSVLSLVLFACASADADQGASFADLPAGLTLEVGLAETISTKSHGAGSPVQVVVQKSVSSGESEVIPAGSRLSGAVREISRDPPKVSVEFVEITIGEFVYPLSAEAADVGMFPHSEMKDEAAKIGGGAAAGAVLGGVIGGDVKGAAIGAAAGAAAGTGVALATKDRWASLPEGSRFTVRLVESTRLPLHPDAGEVEEPAR